MRGQYTNEIEALGKELLSSRKFSKTAYRLMPYIQYCLINHEGIDPCKINEEERLVFMNWKKRGYLKGGISGIECTKEFWNILNEILWLGYVPKIGNTDG